MTGAPSGACDDCLRRTELIASLGSHIQASHAAHRRHPRLLALPDDELIGALAGPHGARFRAAHEAFDSTAARGRARAAGLQTVCRHDAAGVYPAALHELADPPAVLHVLGPPGALGGLTADVSRCVAVVGARRASSYGIEMARSLGHDLAAAGITVVSGMALGVDSAAHAGALAAEGPTVAVLAGGADVAYPATKRSIHRAVARDGCVISEMPPGQRAWRWSFPARNRIIAGLAHTTVVVEAAPRSGSLITADLASGLGRDLGGVPGRVTSPLSTGPNALLADGAKVVRDARDVLETLGITRADRAPPAPLAAELAAVLDLVTRGVDTLPAVVGVLGDADAGMLALGELELLGRVRRDLAGRYTPTTGDPYPG